MDRTILLIDFDSFFASCEQHFNPNLRGKPIGVTAANSRTCIIAASREAKTYGVKTGSLTYEAERICPGIIFIKADFERYLEITKKFLLIATSYSPIVELFSLDEVFIDMTPTLHLFQSLDDVVIQFKSRIRDEIGSTITVSVGVSYNKLLAKLASGLEKPDGYTIITRQNKDEIYNNIELTDLCGIGERYKRRLNMMGIYTLMQLQNCPLHLLKAEFGNVASQNLKRIALGSDDSPVIPYTEESVTKSVGRNYCLPKNQHNQTKILQTIFELSEEIGIKLRRIHKKGRTVGLYLSGDGSMGGRKTVGYHMNEGKDIFLVCKYLYTQWHWNSMVRQIGVWVSNLIDEEYVTIPLFQNPREELVQKAVDAINEKHGSHTVRRGFVLKAPKLKTVPNGFMADKYDRQKIAIEGEEWINQLLSR